jgi:hypothetical protein
MSKKLKKKKKQKTTQKKIQKAKEDKKQKQKQRRCHSLINSCWGPVLSPHSSPVMSPSTPLCHVLTLPKQMPLAVWIQLGSHHLEPHSGLVLHRLPRELAADSLTP